jgi:hypothetical protein
MVLSACQILMIQRIFIHLFANLDRPAYYCQVDS